MTIHARFLKVLIVTAAAALLAVISARAEKPLKIAYSDWPGWVAWEVGIKKGWFQEEGVNAEFIWFEYVPSMEAFSAGKVDGVCVTNGDSLVTAATGAPNVAILINDISNGNDMVVARPGVDSVKDLAGKKVGVEVGFVSHLLLLKALEQNGMKESDVTLVNIPTHETAQALASGDVDAIAAWQPNSGQALKAVAGSKAIFTSANVPGLIYDVLAVSPTTLASRRAELEKLAKVWYRIVDFIKNPETRGEAIEIMAARVNLPPQEYAKFVDGTKIFTLEEAAKAYEKGDGLDSIYGSSKVADAFNVANKVYEQPQDIEASLDPSITLGLTK